MRPLNTKVLAPMLLAAINRPGTRTQSVHAFFLRFRGVRVTQRPLTLRPVVLRSMVNVVVAAIVSR